MPPQSLSPRPLLLPLRVSFPRPVPSSIAVMPSTKRHASSRQTKHTSRSASLRHHFDERDRRRSALSRTVSPSRNFMNPHAISGTFRSSQRLDPVVQSRNLFRLQSVATEAMISEQDGPAHYSSSMFDTNWSPTRSGYAHDYPAVAGWPTVIDTTVPPPYSTQASSQLAMPLMVEEEQLQATAAVFQHRSRKGKTPKSQGDSRRDALLVSPPVPTAEYLHKSLEPSEMLSKPVKLLIVLDLNGTIIYRKKNATSRSRSPQLRPGLTMFLEYLFENFEVLVWTSAQPGNAIHMVNAAFTEDQKKRLLAIWGRDKLGLTDSQYRAKVQVYKKLETVWDVAFDDFHPEDGTARWDQTNTVLLDDSATKAVAQPYNHILLPEFLGLKSQQDDTALSQVMDYLEYLKWQSNVSSYMQRSPFQAVGIDEGENVERCSPAYG